ncbi:MAG: GNAT family N-acetyltransferase [Christensenellaceae bacterium]|nr:GNAT family N-acetyltransferase [Christensenellaceae bacterium]
MEKYTWTRGEYTVTTDITGIDLDKTAKLLLQHSWNAAGRPIEMTKMAFEHSENFICLHKGEPVGYVRMVTDYVTVAYVTDVNVAADYQGRGLSRFIFECIMEHPTFSKMRRIILCSPDARGLYAKFGFVPVAEPQEWMERMTPYGEAYAHFANTHHELPVEIPQKEK